MQNVFKENKSDVDVEACLNNKNEMQKKNFVLISI